MGREKRARHRERTIWEVGGESRDAQSLSLQRQTPGLLAGGKGHGRSHFGGLRTKCSWSGRGREVLTRRQPWDRKGRRRMRPGGGGSALGEMDLVRGQVRWLRSKIPGRDPMAAGQLWAKRVCKGAGEM